MWVQGFFCERATITRLWIEFSKPCSMGFHAKQMFLNGWVRARILGIEWRPNSCANPATKKWKFRRLLSHKHNAAPQFFLYHMDVETFPICSVIPIGKRHCLSLWEGSQKVFLWWVPIPSPAHPPIILHSRWFFPSIQLDAKFTAHLQGFKISPRKPHKN